MRRAWPVQSVAPFHLEQQLAKRRLAPAALASLVRWRDDKDVLRFEIMDASGVLVASSADLASPGAVPPAAAFATDGVLVSSADYAGRRQLAQTGVSYVALRRSSGDNAPLVYSEVLVRLPGGGAQPGLVRVFGDQSQKAADAAAGIKRIGTVVVALLAMIGGLAAYQLVVGRRRQNRAEAKVKYMARHDVLSGALNRASFGDVLAKAAWQSTGKSGPFLLLRVNLDHFKEVNDMHGTAAGDEVLRLTTKRLKAALRKGDELARLGGDEFAVLWRGPVSPESVESVAQRIIKALEEPMQVMGRGIQCGASIGVARCGPDGTDGDELLGKAELALHRAKAGGRATFAVHDESLDQQMQGRRELARELRQAIALGQLSAYYQPLYGQDGELLVGYETLVRWQHPVRGAVSPAEFIPLAEEAGLIKDIGLWVLRQACADAALWPKSLTVAVNLSADQFEGGQLVEQVSAALADSGLSADRLGLEITESLLMHNSTQVMETLRQLAALGVSIAMDDFGTGYSSLAYLWRFPFDKLKIDQVFTKNMENDTKVDLIVRSIIALAHSLGIRVNAEGVETLQQMKALQNLGCDELQGFLLGKPRPVTELTHIGHKEGRRVSMPRGELRESLFSTLPMGLPAPPAS
jgi:diguanylate cyclase (GGDEF)-like protein